MARAMASLAWRRWSRSAPRCRTTSLPSSIRSASRAGGTTSSRACPSPSSKTASSTSTRGRAQAWASTSRSKPLEHTCATRTRTSSTKSSPLSLSVPQRGAQRSADNSRRGTPRKRCLLFRDLSSLEEERSGQPIQSVSVTTAREPKEPQKRQEQVEDVQVHAHREQNRLPLSRPATVRHPVQVEHDEASKQDGRDGRDADVQQRQLDKDAHHRRNDDANQPNQQNPAEPREVTLGRVSVGARRQRYCRCRSSRVEYCPAEPLRNIRLEDQPERHALKRGECIEQRQIERRPLAQELQRDQRAKAADDRQEECARAKGAADNRAARGEHKCKPDQAHDLAENRGPIGQSGVGAIVGVRGSARIVIHTATPVTATLKSQ